jgi:hypothetical protein
MCRSGLFSLRLRLRSSPAASQKKTAEPLRAPPFLLEHQCVRTKATRPGSSARQLHRSVHPLDSVARVTMSLRATLYGLLASTRLTTNDEPRHSPVRPEARPNQRLYEPPGSPPSVAVGLSSTRAAHRSPAPNTDPGRCCDCGMSEVFKARRRQNATPVATSPQTRHFRPLEPARMIGG